VTEAIDSRGLVVLGATGTVGRNTLDVVRRQAGAFRVVALTAGRDAEALFALCREFRPAFAALADAEAALRLQALLREAGIGCEVGAGESGLIEAAAHGDADLVMSAIVGAAGLVPTLAAVRAGRQVLIANKEPLVMAGALLLAEATRHGATILPIDSEHNAIFQCLPAGYRCGAAPKGVTRVILTASGGPFLRLPADAFAAITPAQAVRHPNWTMGPKISVDSATMMNKGLELIEAALLYQLPGDRIDIVVHPQSIIHSMVEYDDGSTLAQLGAPDMRIPIAHALAWPARGASGVPGLDWTTARTLQFEPADPARFPSLRLAREALAAGSAAANVMNAANEVAVAAFLDGAIPFTAIFAIIGQALDRAAGESLPAGADLGHILQVDQWARRIAREQVGRETRRSIDA
jgi:1-deoxy-D-xylulose-5-phosphate reductoisomerase